MKQCKSNEQKLSVLRRSITHARRRLKYVALKCRTVYSVRKWITIWSQLSWHRLHSRTERACRTAVSQLQAVKSSTNLRDFDWKRRTAKRFTIQTFRSQKRTWNTTKRRIDELQTTKLENICCDHRKRARYEIWKTAFGNYVLTTICIVQYLTSTRNSGYDVVS